MKRLLATIDHADAAEPPLRIYAIAVAMSCAAAAATEVLHALTGVMLPFLLGLGAVIASAWLGGAGPALVATALMLAFGWMIAPGLPWVSTQNVVALTVFSIILSIAGEYVVRTRRRDARQRRRLAQRELYLQSIFETLPAAMMIIDRKGVILAMNQTAHGLFAIPATDGEMLSIHDFIDLPPAQGGDEAPLVDRLLARAGQPIAVMGHPIGAGNLHMTVAAAHLQPRDPELITLYLRDETPIRRAADAMAEVQTSVAQLGRAAALGAMGSAIAHELNQPLASATNFAGAARAHLSQRSDTPPQALAAIDSTISQIVRAGEILKGLRTFVRAAPVAPQWLSIHDIIREASQLGHFVLNDMRATLTTEIGANVRYVWTDRVQIQQVLVNLLNNAAEAVAGCDRRLVRISVHLSTVDEVELSVSDTGNGVAADVRKRLFEPFNTSKGLGLGVGLAISKTIVEAHGGKIWYEDSVGGARFCLTLKHSHQGEAGDGGWQDPNVHH